MHYLHYLLLIASIEKIKIDNIKNHFVGKMMRDHENSGKRIRDSKMGKERFQERCILQERGTNFLRYLLQLHAHLKIINTNTVHKELALLQQHPSNADITNMHDA